MRCCCRIFWWLIFLSHSVHSRAKSRVVAQWGFSASDATLNSPARSGQDCFRKFWTLVCTARRTLMGYIVSANFGAGRPQWCHHQRQKRNPHPRGGGEQHRGAASRQHCKGGGGQGAALGEPPSHSRGQATGASRVTRALHPKQVQEGSGGCGGQHGKQDASPRMSPPSRSTQPLRFGLHQGGYRNVAKG